MDIELVEVRSQPMLYITRVASMAPREISGIMAEAFATIGSFIGRAGITPAGPPLALYRDWDMKTGRMEIDVGFPVRPADIGKAAGEVHAGQTPAGKAYKAVHRGPYIKLRDTYTALEEHRKRAGIPQAALAWEVYVTDPEKTPERDLLTEIYMPA
jgi:effector-binding domain-containing protein